MKLQKRIKAATAPAQAVEKTVKAKPVAKVVKAEKKVVEKTASTVALTPKQQQVLDIVAKQPEGLNAKGIGIEAGQEEAKASSWATGALKKLLEENLVEKVQLAGNKVIYKAL